ncbi:unnamed protein product [Prunus armeniaca]
MTATHLPSLPSSPSSLWYADSGATNHITHDLNNLSLKSSYPSTDKVIVGSGEGLDIAHTGSSFVSASNSKFQLHNILHDIATGKLLYRGPTDGHLYPINLSQVHHVSPAALLSTKASASFWHKRLGNPSAQTLQHLLFTRSLPLQGSSITNCVCVDCQLGKSHKLPFNKSICSSSFPLELIHTNIWGPAPVSFVSGN